MPTYEYACTSCGERLEVVQRFSDDPLTECPACSGALRKVFSAVGVVFKGSGFYKTDSRSPASKSSTTEPAKKDTTADSPAKPADAGPGPSSTSDKPAPAPSTGTGSTDRVA
jgi:putative FmdB family regulatory protein